MNRTSITSLVYLNNIDIEEVSLLLYILPYREYLGKLFKYILNKFTLWMAHVDYMESEQFSRKPLPNNIQHSTPIIQSEPFSILFGWFVFKLQRVPQARNLETKKKRFRLYFSIKKNCIASAFGNWFLYEYPWNEDKIV